MRRALVIMAGAALAVGLVAAPGPAGAAATPVTGAATVQTYAVPGGHTISRVYQRGAWVNLDGSVAAGDVSLWPPSGGRFTIGTDPAAWASASPPSLRPTDHVSVATSYVAPPVGCPAPDPTATVSVAQADYDAGGTLTAFAAHVHVTCATTGAAYDVDVRVASDLALDVVGFSVDAGTGAASDSYNLLVINAGSTPVTLGAVSTSDTSPGWSASATSGTCGTTLGARLSCQVHVAFTTDGSAGGFQVHVATPGAPSSEITTWVHPVQPVATPTVRTRSTGDGVLVSWDDPPTAYAATVWHLYRGSSPTGPWTQSWVTAVPRFGDTQVAAGATVYYYVGASTTSPGHPVATSAVVPGTRLASPTATDGTTDVAHWSTRTSAVRTPATWYAPAFLDVDDGPGTYAVPDEVPLQSFTVGSKPCLRPAGTMVVRDLARAATDTAAIVRIDASFTGTCHGGEPIRAELRAGAPGQAFDQVISYPASSSAGRTVWIPGTGSTEDVVANMGTAPVTLGAPTVDAGAHQAEWGVSTTCGTALAPGATCVVRTLWSPSVAGTQTVTVRVPGASLLGTLDLEHTVVAGVDATPPTVVQPPVPPAFVDDRNPFLRPTPYSDAGSGPAGMDARERVASASAPALSAWIYPSSWQNAQYGGGPGILRRLVPGQLLCSSFRGHDVAGNTSAWTTARCTSLVWDDAVLREGAGSWDMRGGSSSQYHGSTWHRSTVRGSTLVGPSVRARRVAVLVTTCPTCGSLDVYIGSTRLGTVSTRSSTVKHRVLLQLPVRSTPVLGRLRLVVHSSGLRVIVDGVGARIA